MTAAMALAACQPTPPTEAETANTKRLTAAFTQNCGVLVKTGSYAQTQAALNRNGFKRVDPATIAADHPRGYSSSETYQKGDIQIQISESSKGWQKKIRSDEAICGAVMDQRSGDGALTLAYFSSVMQGLAQASGGKYSELSLFSNEERYITFADGREITGQKQYHPEAMIVETYRRIPTAK